MYSLQTCPSPAVSSRAPAESRTRQDYGVFLDEVLPAVADRDPAIFDPVYGLEEKAIDDAHRDGYGQANDVDFPPASESLFWAENFLVFGNLAEVAKVNDDEQATSI